MKHIQLLLIVLITWTSCQTMTFDDMTGENDKTSKGEKVMHFRLTGFNVSNMDDVNPEYTSNTKSSTLPKGATDNLILGVFNNNSELVDTIHYQSLNDSISEQYGTFSQTLKYGKYTILALGWNGSQQCLIHSLDSITFSENWVPSTFLCRQNIVVSESYSDTRTLTLKRCVSRFKVILKDNNIPQDLSKFEFSFSQAGNALNSETRHCTQVNNFTRTIPVTIDPAKVTDVSSYCFLPEDSTSINITLTAYNKNKEIIGTKTFTDVPMKINYSTNYTGNFFPIGSLTEQVVFETDYDGEFNNEF